MFEHMTKEKILSDLLSQAPPDVDTRQGSIYYDAVAGAATVFARTYADLDITTKLIYIDSTGGEYLDMKASEHGLTRKPATKAVYEFHYDGTMPVGGSRFYYDGLYFVFENRSGILVLVADAAGEASNHIENETPAVPVNSISGLNSASFGAILVYGEDEESDDDLRDRLRRKIGGPTENGNKAHYKTWCEEIDGVGKARILPLWNGPNTVKGVLISPEGTPVSDAVVSAVQEYVDPDGLGLGEGAANLGAHFTAAKAGTYNINILILGFVLKAGYNSENGYSEAEVIEKVTSAIEEFLKAKNLAASDESNLKIYTSEIIFEMYKLEFVEALSGLGVNSQSASGPASFQTITPDKVAVMGQVDIQYATES